MKAIHSKLQYLATCQQSVDDGTRLYHDGIIRVSTVAEGGGIGFALIAQRVPGAAKLIGHYFEGDESFLKMESLREAIELRDEILTQCIQERTHRSLRAQIEREVKKKNRVRAVRIEKIPKELTTPNQGRRSSTILL